MPFLILDIYLDGLLIQYHGLRLFVCTYAMSYVFPYVHVMTLHSW